MGQKGGTREDEQEARSASKYACAEVKASAQQQAAVKCLILKKLSSSTGTSPKLSMSHLKPARCTGVEKSNGQTSAFY